MTVKVNFGDEIESAIQKHLAVLYYNKMLQLENAGNSCGFGDKSRFSQYNKVVSPKEELDEVA